MLVRPTAVMAALVVITAVLVRPTAVMAPRVGRRNAPEAYGSDGNAGGDRRRARKADGGEAPRVVAAKR